MESLRVLLLLLCTLYPSTLILAQQTPAQTKCTSAVLSGTAAYSDCCPGVGTAPVTFDGKRYKVDCGKEIKFSATTPFKPNPISCIQACNTTPDCVSAYWTDSFGGICTLYTLTTPAAGASSVALVPIPSDDAECNKKIATAISQTEAKKDQECAGKVTAAETKECQRCQNSKICPTLDCSTCKTTPCPVCPKTDCSTCKTPPCPVCPKKDCSTCKTPPCPVCPRPKCPKRNCARDCPPRKNPRPTAPNIPGCGAGQVYGPYDGHYYAAYVGCSGQGMPLGPNPRLSSNHQEMDVCVQMCFRSPNCVLAVREHAPNTGNPASCKMKSTNGGTFVRADHDLILKI
ncbi:hypothetical protein BDV12DRAFT_173222, partial [Aspergillus spectabilis]